MDGGGRTGRLFSPSRIRIPGLRRRAKRLCVSCPDRPPGLNGPACMMSGGNVHAAGASDRVRAGELCPKAVHCARRSSSVPAVSPLKRRRNHAAHEPVIPSSGEEEASNGECRAPFDRTRPSGERRGSMLRSPEPQGRFDRFDFSDFAQEFLRRNPDYRHQFARVRRAGGGPSSSDAVRRRARSWGLEFLRRPFPRCRCPSGGLVPRR